MKLSFVEFFGNETDFDDFEQRLQDDVYTIQGAADCKVESVEQEVNIFSLEPTARHVIMVYNDQAINLFHFNQSTALLQFSTDPTDSQVFYVTEPGYRIDTEV